MTRALSPQKVLHRMTGVFFFTDAAPTGLVVTGDAKGGNTITLTAGDVAAMSLVVGSEIRFGPNGATAEVNQIEAIAVEVLTLKIPLARAVAIAEVATLLIANDLGATDENGVTFATTQDETPVIAGTQRQTYLFIGGNIDQALTFALRDFDVENLAKLFGIDESDATIVDSTGPATAIALNPDDFTTNSARPFKFEGLLEDNTAVTFYIFSAKVAVVNADIAATFGTATILPVNMRSNGNASVLIE